MTHVMNYNAATSLPANNKRKEYMIEAITFDGESVIEYVIARNGNEALSKAAALISNADYLMIQGCWDR